MKKTLVAVLAVALIAGAAFAQAGPQHPQRSQAVLAHYLQLTQDQVTAWQQIDKDTAAAVKPLAQQAHDLQTQVKTALQGTNPDPAAVGKLVVAADAARDQIKALRDTAKTKRLAVLTADQKTKYDAFEAAAQFLRASRPAARAMRAR